MWPTCTLHRYFRRCIHQLQYLGQVTSMDVYRVARTMKHGVVGGELCACPLFRSLGKREGEGTIPVFLKRKK